MVTGIYRIKFENGDSYVGQSSDIEKRWRQHRYSKGHGSPLLQQAFQNQPEPTYELLEETTDLNAREIHHILVLQPNLNIRAGGNAMRSLDHPRSKYTKEQIELVVHYYINTSKSYSEIEDLTNVAKCTVHDICKLRSHHWATDSIPKEVLDTALSARRPTYRLYDPSGLPHEFSDMLNFGLSQNISESSIRTALDTGKNKHGWTSTPPSYYTLETPEGEEFTCTAYEANSFLEALGFSKFCRSQVINKGRPSKGFTLKKLDSSMTLTDAFMKMGL